MKVKIDYSTLTAYHRCPQYFKHRYVDGLTKSSTNVDDSTKPHLLFGTAIHKGLELYHMGASLSDTLHAIHTDYNNTPLRLLGTGERYSFTHYEKLLTAYSQYWQDRNLRFLSAEQKLSAEIAPGITYQGTCDAIAEYNGELVLVEHKTASSIGLQFATMAEMSNQAAGYAMLARLNGIDTRKVLYNALQTLVPKLDKWIRTQSAEHLVFQRELVDRTNDDIERYMHDIIITVDDIKRDLQANYFVQKRHEPCTAFGGCEFKNVCLYPKVDQRHEFIIEHWRGFSLS